MSIAKETELAQKYILKRSKNGMLEISLDNVARAEAMINSDSRYSQKEVEKNINLLKYNIDKKLIPNPNYQTIFTDIVSSINRLNKTRMSNDEIQQIVFYLLSKKDELITRLYQRDFCLVYELTKCSKRKNYSFATKFCHYMCYFLFEDKEQQDNYSIYDKVVAQILGVYAAQYGICKFPEGIPYNIKDFQNYDTYDTYSGVIDKIINASGEEISRNGFDHLLWYANK